MKKPLVPLVLKPKSKRIPTENPMQNWRFLDQVPTLPWSSRCTALIEPGGPERSVGGESVDGDPEVQRHKDHHAA